MLSWEATGKRVKSPLPREEGALHSSLFPVIFKIHITLKLPLQLEFYKISNK